MTCFRRYEATERGGGMTAADLSRGKMTSMLSNARSMHVAAMMPTDVVCFTSFLLTLSLPPCGQAAAPLFRSFGKYCSPCRPLGFGQQDRFLLLVFKVPPVSYATTHPNDERVIARSDCEIWV